MRNLVWMAAVAAVLVGAVAAYVTLEPRGGKDFKAVDITGVSWGHGFELADNAGRRRTLGDFRGKVVMLSFGYTSCPDMCPMTLALLGTTLRQMGDEAKQVQVLFVTVDPKRDTPQLLAQYVPAFYPTFLGLYADEATTERTVNDFKVYRHLNSANKDGSYTVDHSGQVFVFDAAGRLRLMIRPDRSTPEDVTHDLRLLVRESAS